MVKVKGSDEALARLLKPLRSFGIAVFGGIAVVLLVYSSCTARVAPNEWGVELVKFGGKTGIGDRAFEAGIYIVPPGTTLHSFPREIHVLEASFDKEDAIARSKDQRIRSAVAEYFERRDHILGGSTHRVVEALNVQTSDGYAVTTDITLLYSIRDPVIVAKSFGLGPMYIDAFVLNSFRNGVLTTLGKMAAEDFYDEQRRTAALADAKQTMAKTFGEKGFAVNEILIRNYRYSDLYEKSLQEKKVAVQLTVKNKKETVVNEERAKLQHIESKGQADITITESEVDREIARIDSEAKLYSSEVRAKADRELGLAEAEAKRLKSEALTASGGRNLVALELAKMFDNIEGAVMTPEQYVAFVRNAWALMGIGGGR
ncbi:MAG: hypothetical protein HY791_02680 [Deltaproteobacteria bacterium]|nr:hypothetical protein [Deltaproteobacteria bacterium]